jgi:hypothetical protein
MDVGRRLKLGLLALVATIGVTFAFSTVAQARTIQDPNLSNIPYLAWRGEQIRLVKCESPAIVPALSGAAAFDWILVDWSGNAQGAAEIPKLVTGSQKFGIRSFDGAFCWGATFESAKAGLAQIKLVVTDATGTKILVHDFLAGWMNLNSIVLCDNNGAGLCTGPTTSTITETAGAAAAGDVLEANVTGNIPLLADFTELGIGHSITLPDGTTANGVVLPNDWATLAGALATVRGPTGDPVSWWDTHDDTLPTTGHAQESPNPPCTTRTTSVVDAVSQCSDTGAVALENEQGAFSSIWSTLIGPPAYGPFDPIRAGQTYLSDGKVDSGDAPMPAARIDFTIGANTSPTTSTAGVGSFVKVDKGYCSPSPNVADLQEPAAPFGCVGGTYVRAGATTPEHLYAPFYRRYIPATLAPGDPFSSGTDGGFANDFNGYLNLTGNALANPTGLYDFWDIAEVLRTATAAATACPFVVAGAPVGLTPGGPAVGLTVPQSVAIYSDEHGEARVAYAPGTGFFFGALVAPNANGGCDLAGIATLGTSAITATARYPYQPVTARPLVSNTVAKSIASAFSKSIQCFPKGTSAFDQQVAVCVAHAQDITGTAIAGEKVCFFADSNAEGMFLPPAGTISIGPYTGAAAITIIPSTPLVGSTNNVCALTDVNGNTAVEVVNSNTTTVNVTAYFVFEGIFRSIHVTFPITGPTAAITGPTAGQQKTTTVTTTGTQQTNGGPQTTPPTNTKPETTDPAVTVRWRITAAKLVRSAKPYLLIKLSGPAGNANLNVRYSSGSTSFGNQIVSVPANKLAKVRLNIPKKVKTLYLSVMPG